MGKFVEGIVREGERKRRTGKWEGIVKQGWVLEGYNQVIWDMIKDGEVEKADKMIKVTSLKLQSHVITHTTP